MFLILIIILIPTCINNYSGLFSICYLPIKNSEHSSWIKKSIENANFLGFLKCHTIKCARSNKFLNWFRIRIRGQSSRLFKHCTWRCCIHLELWGNWGSHATSKYPVPLACAEVLHVLNAGATSQGENLLPLPGQIRLIQLVFCSCSGFKCSELNCELRIAGKYTVLLACTAAFYVLDANGNPKQMRLRNTQTVRHFMHLRVIQMHACECEMRVNYAKSVNQNSSTACTETKVLVVRLKYWIFNSS